MSSWQLYNTGLPNVIVDDLEIQYSAGKLRAATYGRGVWESDLFTPVGVQESIQQEGFVSIYPNPAQTDFTVSTSVLTKDAHMQIYNTLGDSVYQSAIESESFSVTLHSPKGVYFVKISDGEKQYVQKLII